MHSKMRQTTAFTTPIHSLRFRQQISLRRCNNVCPVITRPRLATGRRPVRMIGPFFPDLSNSNLMKSEIVRNEMGSLERDYVELAKLGTRYETFDREGKIMYIERALDVVDRFAIFITRLKLSEEFAAQMFIKQYTLRLEEVGLTIDSMIANTKKSLEMMHAEVGKL